MALVLLVEDEWLIAQDHAAVLRNAGHQVAGPFRDSDTALAEISAAPPDLALLDVRLDHHTSIPVATELKEQEIPFAFVTGLEGADIPDQFDDVPLLAKPVGPEHLLDVIARLRDDPSRRRSGQSSGT
ncbi:hypothetical protein OB2597_19386 [Pseudooceanicola batsensis HTCC2597]|uniref:Response regulatory domain-containing protein n=1 Tax=Pseudooceanicola batsensis (strain ATCC BAA-863 / DSM 15984 / KCTC 12145 / HTCC2597) TaxID=252305 RepID=A3U0I7_PSEBH|nr:response regulator [Pseudooceanicola batsensis]EAQ02278.1 hypothetical protein OB2597_19386 [Pseudooceanicola batsensis HTCC2597]